MRVCVLGNLTDSEKQQAFDAMYDALKGMARRHTTQCRAVRSAIEGPCNCGKVQADAALRLAEGRT